MLSLSSLKRLVSEEATRNRVFWRQVQACSPVDELRVSLLKGQVTQRLETCALCTGHCLRNAGSASSLEYTRPRPLCVW